MNLKSIVFFCSLLCNIAASAQSFYITGTVKSGKGLPLPKAKVELLLPSDSTVLKTAFTDSRGEYTLEGVERGEYLLRSLYSGYEVYFLTLRLDSIKRMDILMFPEAQMMQGARAKGSPPPVSQKGDTSEYRAGAYKTNPDASAEDLVNKMPGVTNSNGKVQVQGEDVRTVLVDGKPFFGDDPAAALKNLPADAIDKIQVFDQKSNQSQFTGFDDGNTSKTINIITKAQYKNGVFGKVYGGYGYEDKWRGGASINSFKNERKISFLFNTNNINEQNFSADDLLGVMTSTGGSGGQGPPRGGMPGGGSRGGMQGGGPQNSSDNFLTNNQNGIVTTNAFGLNYTNKWKKADLTGSYFFNHTTSDATSIIFRTYITNESDGLLYSEVSKSLGRNMNQRFNLKLDWKIDSSSSMLIQPRFSSQRSEPEQSLAGINIQDSVILSDLINKNISDQRALNLSIPILYRYSFLRKGRTLSLNATPGYSESSGNNNLYSYNQFTDTLPDDTINQLSVSDKEGMTLSSNLTWSEPVSKNAQILLNYTGNINYNNADKQTNQFVPAEGDYTQFDTLLSNTFKSRYVSHAAGVNYNYRKDKLNFSFGGNYQRASQMVNNIFPKNYNDARIYESILPTAMLQYRFTKQKNIRFFYRSANNIPGIDQLQDIVNNSNPLQLKVGNSALRQDFQNSMNIRYSSADPVKNTAFFLVLGGTITRDYIAGSTYIASADTLFDNQYILPKGSQIAKPVNLDGYHNFRTFTNYSFVVKKIKSNVNVNAYGNVSRTPGMINYAVNYARSSNVGMGISLSSNISKNLDFTISANSAYSTISNTIQEQSNSRYLNQNGKLKVQAMPWKGLVLQTDVSYQMYAGLSETINTNFTLWNAGIGYKFLKDRLAEVRLVAFDLLQQNTSLTRNTTETYYEDVRTNMLQRYFMLNFTYNIKYFKKSS